METKQETKSLPRNRKCGNCRYFEPAPLWRKGWCRNPRLYDRRANHLVDAATIDCEQVFRARIYWEPVPVPEPIDADMPVIDSYRDARPSEEPTYADGGGRARRQGDGVLRPTGNRPVIQRREKATATPNLVGKPSQVRKWLMENIPYYDRIDGPITRWNVKMWLPWVVVVLLLFIVLLNVVGGKKDPKTDDGTLASSTVGALTSVPGTGTPGATKGSGTAAANPVANGSPKPTSTLSNAVPTATVAPATPTTAAKTVAKVVNTQGKGVKMRKEPHISSATEPSNVLAQIAEGQEVEITGPYKTAEGLNWWPVTYKGQSGWVAQDYLQKKE